MRLTLPTALLVIATMTLGPGALGDTSADATLETDQTTYHRLAEDLSREKVRITFTNNGPGFYSCDAHPWWVTDEAGHYVFSQGGAAVMMVVGPGETVTATWEISEPETYYEDEEDAASHGSPTHEAYRIASIPPPGEYTIHWGCDYFDGPNDGDPTWKELTVTIVIEEGWAGAP